MNFINYYDDVLPKDICDNIIQISKDSFKLDRVKHNKLGRNFYRIPKEYFELVNNQITYSITSTLKKYKEEYNLDQTYHYSYKVHYNPVGGYVNWHDDHGGKTESSWKRKLVFILYLNDLDEGELQFKYFPDVNIMPKAGRCIIMPTGWTHSHKADKLFKEKFILTGFFS